MVSREYIDIMLSLEINSRGLWKTGNHVQELAKNLGNSLQETEAYLETATPAHLIAHPEILDEAINKTAGLADDLETIAGVVGAQIATIKKLIKTARALGNSEEAGNVEE